MIVFLVGAVFSAGVLWNKVDNLEDQQVTFKTDMDKGIGDLNDKVDALIMMQWTTPTSISSSDDF